MVVVQVSTNSSKVGEQITEGESEFQSLITKG